MQARDLTAKVADVGLAKLMKGDHFTQVSTLGTLAWAAPELLRCEPWMNPGSSDLLLSICAFAAEMR